MEQERDRLKHLLIILLEALSTSSEAHSSRRLRIQEKVAAAGMDEDDVNGLLDWIESHWDLRALPSWARNQLSESPSPVAVRVFGEEEAESLTESALAYLMDLQARGEIDRAEFEALLHYASLMGSGPLELADLETVIEQVLFRPNRPGMTGGASEGLNDLH